MQTVPNVVALKRNHFFKSSEERILNNKVGFQFFFNRLVLGKKNTGGFINQHAKEIILISKMIKKIWYA
jgi:hypothetical protein